MSDATVAPDSETAGQSLSVKLAFDGRAGELVGMVLANLFLTIITLGIYRFWAKTRIRRYFWAHTRLNGKRSFRPWNGSRQAHLPR